MKLKDWEKIPVGIIETIKKSWRVRKISEKLRDYVLLRYQEVITGSDKNEWKQVINKRSIKRRIHRF